MSKVYNNHNNIYFCISMNPCSSQHFTYQRFLIIIIFIFISLNPNISQRFNLKVILPIGLHSDTIYDF